MHVLVSDTVYSVGKGEDEQGVPGSLQGSLEPPAQSLQYQDAAPLVPGFISFVMVLV